MIIFTGNKKQLNSTTRLQTYTTKSLELTLSVWDGDMK
jgi:hypothetical protein